jgi:hypothetical protein
MPVNETKHTVCKRLVFSWTSDDDGGAEIVTEGVYDGKLISALFVPGADTDQPSDEYDVTLEDSLGVDLFAGQGEDLAQAAISVATESEMLVACGERLTLRVENAGDTKSGTVVVYIR